MRRLRLLPFHTPLLMQTSMHPHARARDVHSDALLISHAWARSGQPDETRVWELITHMYTQVIGAGKSIGRQQYDSKVRKIQGWITHACI